ncbi:glutamine amidotransferase [Mumia sp. zg.B53]|uniref:glutamine amidotransferase n=1 Tax=unclassified Mumia TaxID=2621872 RepID=UPI001C6EBB5E|nr:MULTISPECIES: glutamine amidotransferase [unclassified Mumia]MBW9207711.1 glutamine amidotransferase [Mumia sp. zg.B17]MBW9214547.1 glutamine amidotransferase [Mumia sp. zg.B53]MDD9347668.1 glutamine amidotransferase [Mumia sp.]
MRPFLLLSIRADDDAADEEYAAFLRFGGLTEETLHRVRMETTSLDGVAIDDYAGFILGGGPFNASDPPETKSSVQRRVEAELAELLDDVVDKDVPFLGACYGIGVLGTHQGATVDRRFGEPISSVPVTLTEAGRDDPVFGALPETFTAFVGHKEAISTLPPTAVVLASSPQCPVQAFRVGRHVYATQFHPELDVEGLCTRITTYQHHGYYDPPEHDALQDMARASVVVDPPTVVRRFVAVAQEREQSRTPAGARRH